MASVQKFIDFYERKENKERLHKLVKEHGQFKILHKKHGYIYQVQIGEFESKPLMLEVALKCGQFTILSVFHGESSLPLKEAANN